MSVPCQGHFYCTKSNIDSCWLIYERPCKKKRIYGAHIGTCKSRYYAYKLRGVLEKMYRLGAYDKLARWRFVFGSSCLWKSDIYFDSLAFARQLLAEFTSDDSQVMSAPILSNGA